MRDVFPTSGVTFYVVWLLGECYALNLGVGIYGGITKYCSDCLGKVCTFLCPITVGNAIVGMEYLVRNRIGARNILHGVAYSWDKSVFLHIYKCVVYTRLHMP